MRGEVGTVSLGQVIDGLLMSGFPALQRLEQDATAEQMRSYAEEISRTDMRRLADIRQDPVLILQLIKALARSTASEVTMKTLRADLSPVKPNIDEETVSRLVGLLERLFVVDAVGAWVPSLRSRARLRTSPKFHLCDPALSAAVLGASSQMLMKDVKTLGFLFESAVIHDLTVMVESMGGQVHHYRDSNGHEIDAVIVLPDGRWGGIEVKLGGGQAESGSRSLRAAADQIDGPEPAFLAVVTGTGQCLPPDERGVQTFPLSALAP